ncbi:MAG: hypothetical protein ACE5ET_01475 [Gammaproteobacteria bacterium]
MLGLFKKLLTVLVVAQVIVAEDDIVMSALHEPKGILGIGCGVDMLYAVGFHHMAQHTAHIPEIIDDKKFLMAEVNQRFAGDFHGFFTSCSSFF